MTSKFIQQYISQFCLSLLPFPRALYLRPAILHAVKLSQRYVEYKKPADDAYRRPGNPS